MPKYQCLNENLFFFPPYRIEPLRLEDMHAIKTWRNAQIDALRQVRPLTDEDQQTYYAEMVTRSFAEPKPRIILFSFLLGDQCIGYGGLTNIDWDAARAELSFLLDPERTRDHNAYASDFSAFITLVKEVAFEQLRFHRLFTETYDLRPWHVRVLAQSGFEFEGRMRDHVKINGRWVDSLLHGCVRGSDGHV